MILRRLVSLSLTISFLVSCAGTNSGKINETTLSTQATQPKQSTEPRQPAEGKDPSSVARDQSYVLGEGDDIEVQVWRQDSLERSLTVDTCGNIVFPLIGEFKVAGMTTKQCSEEIAKRLSKYYVDPVVDIRVIAVKSQMAHIFGEVSSPGSYVLDHKTSAWELIARGGFTEHSNSGKVILIRGDSVDGRNPSGHSITVLNMDPTEMQSGSVSAGAAYLQNGDILYVPPKRITGSKRFATSLAAILSPILGTMTTMIMVPQLIDALSGVGTTSNQGVIIGR